MKRLAPAVLLLLLAGSPAVAGSTPPAPPAAKGKLPGQTVLRPKLVVRQPALDIGVVAEGQDAVATFTLENAGDADLKILRAKPS